MASLLRALARLPDFLWLGALLVTALALAVPEPFLAIRPYITWLLGSVILCMGLTLRLEDFKRVLTLPRAVVTFVASQYTVMSLVGFGVATALLRGNPLWAAGLILTGACPTGVVSNVYAYIGGGNVALSVTGTAVTTLVSPLLTPLLTLLLAGLYVPVDVRALFIDMVQVVLVPTAVGTLFNTYLGKYVSKVRPALPAWSTIMVVIIIGAVVAGGRAVVLSMGPLEVAALSSAAAFHVVAGYVLGWWYGRAARLSVSDKATIAIGTAMQNSGLATVLAMKHWGASAALPAIVFSVVQNLVGPCLVHHARRATRMVRH